MKKIYAKANEKFVKAVVLYADSESVLCYDSEATDKVPADVVKNLFEKGLVLVSTATAEYKPVTLEDKTTYISVYAMSKTGTAVEFKSDTIA